jgi:hypothetical protein
MKLNKKFEEIRPSLIWMMPEMDDVDKKAVDSSTIVNRRSDENEIEKEKKTNLFFP